MITITPRMYRQAIAISIRSQRPGCDVKLASAESTATKIAVFNPHLLVHNENDGVGTEAMAGVQCRVAMHYTDGMDARITARGEVREAQGMSTEDLLQVLDAASTLVGQ